jgi:hypothetical protein
VNERVRELFVWYHVDERNAAAARTAVEAMLRSLEASVAGLHARLLIRRDADRQTWMETFARSSPAAGKDPGIDAATEAAIAAAAVALRPLLASDRHVEAFDVVGRAG